MYPVLSGESTETPRDQIPVHMDYMTGTGGMIVTVDGTYFKLFKESCLLWYDYTDGNTTVLGYGTEGEEVRTDIDPDTYCDVGDTDYYRFYDLSNDASEIHNLY